MLTHICTKHKNRSDARRNGENRINTRQKPHIGRSLILHTGAARTQNKANHSKRNMATSGLAFSEAGSSAWPRPPAISKTEPPRCWRPPPAACSPLPLGPLACPSCFGRRVTSDGFTTQVRFIRCRFDSLYHYRSATQYHAKTRSPSNNTTHDRLPWPNRNCGRTTSNDMTRAAAKVDNLRSRHLNSATINPINNTS